jgi:peroxiredoxin
VITRGYFDMKPDGTIKMNPSFVIGYNPNIVFPRLPSTAADIPKGWKGLLERTFVTTTYTMKDPDGDQLVFVGEESGPYHAINKRFDRWSYHFDLAKGLVTKVDAENGQEYGGEQKGSGQIALDKEDQLSEADVKAWADDQEAFVKVYEQAEDMIRKASAGAANADELFQQAHEALTQGSEAAKADSVKADYADALQRQEMAERMAKSYAQRAESAKNQPAVDFTLNDLQGQPHKFADQVGKVVVVDLFRRNGSQCAYTIPQVVEASKKLKDKPVVFFGATDDSDEADIKAVVDATGIKFPVLKLEGPMSDFGAPSAPATVIIDQKGNVSQILQGYSKSRGQDVVELVEALLKNPE